MLRRCCVDVSQSFDGLLQDFLPHAEDSLSTLLKRSKGIFV